jgi:hypothetical protein
VLLGRTVLLIVARWFVLGAREREREMRFSAGLGHFVRRNILLTGCVCMCGVLQVASPEWRRANEMKVI